MVGVVNTMFGFSIIFLLMYLGVSATTSNAIGYALGSLLSYFLNRKYTFNSEGERKREALKFFVVLAFAYGLNFLTLQWGLTLFNPYLAQFFSAVVYTLSSFVMAKLFVFKETK